MEITLSSTLIKQLISKGTELAFCPLKVGATYIYKTTPKIYTLSMQKGHFFETLCLGSTSNHEQILDLPRKTIPETQYKKMLLSGINEKNIKGEKTIDQLRIETQANTFKELIKEYNIIINQENIGVKFNIEYETLSTEDCKVFLKGEIDFIGNYNGESYIFDLKLTKNIHNTYGNYGWGNPYEIDTIQATIYSYIYKLPFIYWIFDYKKEPENKLLKKSISGNDILEMKETFRKSVEIIKYQNLAGWKETNPSYENCTDCPFKGNCEKSFKPIANIFEF